MVIPTVQMDQHHIDITSVVAYSMCSLAVSTLDSPAVDHLTYYGALSSNRKVDGSRLTGSAQVCHS